MKLKWQVQQKEETNFLNQQQDGEFTSSSIINRSLNRAQILHIIQVSIL